MMDKSDTFDAWCIIDLFGHAKIAGRVTEATIGGQSFVRVDVPEGNGQPAFTKFFGPGAIYSVTPTTEELVVRALRYIHAEPVSVYIPPERHLPAPYPDRSASVEPEDAHDCKGCGGPCDCGCAISQGAVCSGCSACDPGDDDEGGF